jgi:hypothetical protein
MEGELITDVGDGKFEFIDQGSRPYLENAHWAITQCELWDWLRTYSPPDGKGFMFSTTAEMDRIVKKMYEEDIANGHSGASYACTMRVMEYIAKNGYERYKTEVESRA